MRAFLLISLFVAATFAASPIECSVCEWVVGEADRFLSENATVEEVNTLINNLCNYVPAGARAICDNFIDLWADDLIALFVSKETPDKFCHLLHLCSKATAANDYNSAIYATAQSWIGRSTAAGPDGGKLACAWTVNHILSEAIHRTIGSNPNYVPSVEDALKGGAGVPVPQSGARAGDLVIAHGQQHIGIYMGGGRVQSNSSSRACYCWNSSNIDFDGSMGGSSRVYRVK
ncbi:hypothetical protein PAPYR_13540 [Paratrimastix pyriformis]|uniref:Saposin B-type domain-containing protein n=1 Tax=Paratrimastix pyriformis TaxID=342808 RepID=A0ABQ8UH61_9EUKA|nr:hypothetical protein PAPYR_13540 [Paratrimastix pyriformis]